MTIICLKYGASRLAESIHKQDGAPATMSVSMDLTCPTGLKFVSGRQAIMLLAIMLLLLLTMMMWLAVLPTIMLLTALMLAVMMLMLATILMLTNASSLQACPVPPSAGHPPRPLT